MHGREYGFFLKLAFPETQGHELVRVLQDVLPEDERVALLAARHRPNAALQVLSQIVAGACLLETQARQPFGQRPNIGLG